MRSFRVALRIRGHRKAQLATRLAFLAFLCCFRFEGFEDLECVRILIEGKGKLADIVSLRIAKVKQILFREVSHWRLLKVKGQSYQFVGRECTEARLNFLE